MIFIKKIYECLEDIRNRLMRRHYQLLLCAKSAYPPFGFVRAARKLADEVAYTASPALNKALGLFQPFYDVRSLHDVAVHLVEIRPTLSTHKAARTPGLASDAGRPQPSLGQWGR